MGFRTVTVQVGQSLFDILVQEHGSVDRWDELVSDNPGVVLGEPIAAGTVLMIRQDAVPGPIAAYFKRNNINVNTNANPGGIGFWIIGTTLKVI